MMLVRLAGARQFGICGKHLGRMSRHLDFGDDGDIAVGGIPDYLAQIVLGVEPTGSLRVGSLAIFVVPVFP